MQRSTSNNKRVDERMEGSNSAIGRIIRSAQCHLWTTSSPISKTTIPALWKVAEFLEKDGEQMKE